MTGGARLKNHRLAILVFGFFGCLVVLAAAGVWLHNLSNSGPISKKIKAQAGFALYYPSSLPAGYSLQKSSVRLSQGVVFLSIVNDSQIIAVSEQIVPNPAPDFQAIERGNQSFKTLTNLTGQAIYGVSEGIPAAILLTNTTLINISGGKNVPLYDVAKTAQNMSPLP